MLARIYLIITVTIWGWTFVATRICLTYLSPELLLASRLVLALPVVVAGDGAAAEVDVPADFGVAEIGQVARLGTGAEMRLLGLDEVADLVVAGEVGAGAQMRHRADGAVVAEHRFGLASMADETRRMHSGELDPS